MLAVSAFNFNNNMLADGGEGSAVVATDVNNNAFADAGLRDTLPVLHSNPGASKTLYLNFLGSTLTQDWKTDVGNLKGLVTHPFDIDGNRTDFSAVEQNMIRDIWKLVSEDYALFDIDVTTSYSGSFANGVALNVAIGATSNDGILSSGKAPLGGFLNSQPNTALVVTSNIMEYVDTAPDSGAGSWIYGVDPFSSYNGSLWTLTQVIGNTISHESGHTFGLWHHLDLSKRIGSNEYEYHRGTDTWTPIMGENLSSDRVTWSYAPIGRNFAVVGAPVIYQDQIAKLGAVLGFRPDDHADVNSLATPMTVVQPGVKFVQQGLINSIADVDVFSFTVKYSGLYEIHMDVTEFANLDARLAVYDAEGAVVTFEDEDLEVHRTVSLKAGTQYYLYAMQHAEYGSVGQYTVGVNLSVPDLGGLTQPMSLDSPDAAYDLLAYYVDQQLGLSFGGNEWLNWGGMNEKWLLGSAGEWYFILPDGSFYRWDGSGTASGAFIASLDPSFYVDLSLLYDPVVGSLAYELDQQYGLHLDANAWFNSYGQNEKWIMSENDQWYFILPNGYLYRWDGTDAASGDLVATLDESYWSDLGRLITAYA